MCATLSQADNLVLKNDMLSSDNKGSRPIGKLDRDSNHLKLLICGFVSDQIFVNERVRTGQLLNTIRLKYIWFSACPPTSL